MTHDFPTQAALVQAMETGQQWRGIRTAPADGHPGITVSGGLHVETTTPAKGNPGAFLLDVGPLVEASCYGLEVLVTDADPGDDIRGAMDRVVVRALMMAR